MKIEFKKVWQFIMEYPLFFKTLGATVFWSVAFFYVLRSTSLFHAPKEEAGAGYFGKDSIAVQIERGDRAYFTGHYLEALDFYESAVGDVDFLRSERPGENDVDLIIQPLRSRLNLTEAAIGLAKINTGLTSQGVADQPAAAVESKSEDSEKPKPESEGRSQ